MEHFIGRSSIAMHEPYQLTFEHLNISTIQPVFEIMKQLFMAKMPYWFASKYFQNVAISLHVRSCQIRAMELDYIDWMFLLFGCHKHWIALNSIENGVNMTQINLFSLAPMLVQTRSESLKMMAKKWTSI